MTCIMAKVVPTCFFASPFSAGRGACLPFFCLNCSIYRQCITCRLWLLHAGTERLRNQSLITFFTPVRRSSSLPSWCCMLGQCAVYIYHLVFIFVFLIGMASDVE